MKEFEKYIAGHFENSKELYNDILQWVKYFLVGVEKTAANSVKDNLISQINSGFGRRSNSALKLLHTLFQSPVTTIDNATKKCSLSYKAANDLVRLMQEKQIVEEMTGQSRNRISIFKQYLEIFSD